MSKGKFALGALIGTAVGVVTGFLTAPKSGKETRADLKKKTSEVKDEVTKQAKFVASDAKFVAKNVKTKVEETTDNVKTEASDLTRRTKRAIDAAKKSFSEDK